MSDKGEAIRLKCQESERRETSSYIAVWVHWMTLTGVSLVCRDRYWIHPMLRRHEQAFSDVSYAIVDMYSDSERSKIDQLR
jgi:hypothetical protein